MTKTGIDTAPITASSTVGGGVTPPVSRRTHSSSRFAPARAGGAGLIGGLDDRFEKSPQPSSPLNTIAH